MKDLMSIKQRVMYLAELKGVKKMDLYEKIGMNQSSFAGENIQRGMTSESIAKIIEFFPDVSPDWLLTGKEPIMRETPVPVPPDKLEAHRLFTQQFKDFAEQLYFLSKQF